MYKVCFIFLFTTVLFLAPAQNDANTIDEKTVKTALRNGNFNEAIRQLTYLLKFNPKNTEYHALIGYAYLNSLKSYPKAVEHFEAALSATRPDPYVYYDYGVALMRCYRFDEAIAAFEKFQKSVSSKNAAGFTPSPARYIEMCGNAKTLFQNPSNVIIKNLGENINTEFPDFNPFIDQNESTLYFATKRSKNPTGIYDADGYKTADIYYSTRQGDDWTPARRLASGLNTPYVEEIVGLTADGGEILLYLNNLSVVDDVYISTRKGRSYGLPENLGLHINQASSVENSAAISPDKKYLFFASDRSESKGGFDIFYCRKLPDGNWSMPVNAGDSVNTAYNDAYPFLAPDGKTFYFASEGHNSMGGYDIFKCIWDAEAETFSKPVNLGYPVNTPNDNKTISVSKSGRYAYFSDFRDGGLGNLDIYKATFLDVPPPYYVFKGGLFSDDSLTSAVLKRLKITATETTTGKRYQFYSAAQTGKWAMILPPGAYRILVDSYRTKNEILVVPDAEPEAETLPFHLVIH